MIDLKANPFFLDDVGIAWVNKCIEEMTLEEKIGQLFCPVGITLDKKELKEQFMDKHIGGMMYRPCNGKDLQETHQYLQSQSKIPLLLAANLETGGNGAALDGTFYARQMQVAATDDINNAYHLGAISCKEGAAVGCNWAFAPVVDIDMNFRNPITNVRTYGANPTQVMNMAKEFLRGAKENNVAVSIKHFPGDGVDERDQHIIKTINSLSTKEWDESYGMVYQELINEGALTVMVGHIAQPAYNEKISGNAEHKYEPATLSKTLLQGLLRNKLGFNGMIVTDATQMVGFCTEMPRKEAVPFSIASGCDMFLFNRDFAEDYDFMMEGYNNGLITQERLEEALTRILAVKASLKLHEKQKAGTLVPTEAALSVLKCDEHIDLAKDCANNSVTLVKDTQELLPLSPEKTKRIYLQVMSNSMFKHKLTEDIFNRFEKEGFLVELYQEETPQLFQAKSVEAFGKEHDLVVYIADIENMSNYTHSRLNWNVMHGSDNQPWFVSEIKTIMISLSNPYHLLDAGMIKTYINTYSNSDYSLDALFEKIMGRSSFIGKSPVDPFCGREDISL